MNTETERMTRWVRDHQRAVLGFVFGLVRDRHVADDLVQETFYRAWKARARYTDLGQERAYLLRIADRLATDRFRRRHEADVDHQRWQQIQPVDESALSPPELLAENETERALAAALESLSWAQRRTVLLRYFGNLTFDEIARQLNCPLGTALSHCRRALDALRRLLVEQER